MKKLNNKKVVVFDFDGTIVDSMESFAQIAAQVMPKHYEIDAKTAYEKYILTSGLPFFEQLETLFPGNSANPQASLEFETIKKQSYTQKRVFADADETLKTLQAKNIKVVVSSNNFQELVDDFVKQAEISFDLVLGYRVNFAKGADHFKYILQEVGCTHEEITFVGDSLKDADKASMFGIDFIGKTGTFSTDDFKKHKPGVKVITTLAELKEMF
ncbi:MAG: HAD-IA family hydrolase [Pseudomonadota bacterium]